MIRPSEIARKPHVIVMPKTDYSFPNQIREGEGEIKNPLSAGYYTMGSIQTYGMTGYPNDARGDNWD